MKPFELTQENRKAFEVFGYLSFPGLLAGKVDTIVDAFERVWAQRGGGHAGKPHAGQARSCIFPFIDQSETLSSLLEDPAIDSILTGLLGPDYNYVGSDGNYYAADTPWHSDGWCKARQYVYAKVAFYLDPLTRDTGALRIIPGSHGPDAYGRQLQEQIGNSMKNWGMAGNEVPSLALETIPGDVVVFNHSLKHSAFGGGKARRMFTINSCQRFAADDVDMLKSYIGNHARFWNDSLYGPAMLAGPDRRRIHLEQVLANEDHLPALAAKARRDMAEPARG